MKKIRLEKKTSSFSFRISERQKQLIKELRVKHDINISAYLVHQLELLYSTKKEL